MKAALFKGPNKIVIDEIPVPESLSNEIQIKIASTGICGTDIHLFKGGATVNASENRMLHPAI